jgi:hypothetical protein
MSKAIPVAVFFTRGDGLKEDMMKRFRLGALLIGLTTVSIVTLAGCGEQADPDLTSAAPATGDGHVHGQDDPTHGGWWCYEHGVPEEQCAMCNVKLAADMRNKGDWCQEHNRPDSLCFKCHPENAEKFVALYEAKFGKQPPQPTD